MVRIRGFHPRGPGSIPGLGDFFVQIYAILKWWFQNSSRFLYKDNKSQEKKAGLTKLNMFIFHFLENEIKRTENQAYLRKFTRKTALRTSFFLFLRNTRRLLKHFWTFHEARFFSFRTKQLLKEHFFVITQENKGLLNIECWISDDIITNRFA